MDQPALSQKRHFLGADELLIGGKDHTSRSSLRCMGTIYPTEWYLPVVGPKWG